MAPYPPARRGVLIFLQPRASAWLARMVEDLGFDSLVFADTQNITPNVWGQLMLAARHNVICPPWLAPGERC